MFALKLSFVLRYQMNIHRTVVIPLAKLADINLAGEDIADKVLAAIIDDDVLMEELFGSYMWTYRGMAEETNIFWKDLMRFQEELVLVPVEA